MAVLGSSLVVTAIAVAGGLGFVPTDGERPPTASAAAGDTTSNPIDATSPEGTGGDTSGGTNGGPNGGPNGGTAKGSDNATRGGNEGTMSQSQKPDSTALPEGSGSGRRAVFSESAQRVWLVEDDGSVQRTYRVSGSVTDNLDPGTYEVYSRSEQAYGIDDSGTMQWFVRFTRGENAAIGFHNIPVDDGQPVQTIDQLGTPLSHGCIRQKESDALAMWDFAPIGTTVVVI